MDYVVATKYVFSCSCVERYQATYGEFLFLLGGLGDEVGLGAWEDVVIMGLWALSRLSVISGRV